MSRESQKAKRERAAEIIRRLKEQYPESQISLRFDDDFQLLVSVMLSAQCTDAMVNQVTPKLFARFATPHAMASADRAELEAIIRPTGFYRQKAKNVQGAARRIVEEHGGDVPDTMAELTALPGVARKTANVVLWNAHGKRKGIAVDTHVKRIANLLRLTRHDDPNKIEQDLMKVVPEDDWGQLTHLIIDHGRAVCVARRPKCEICFLTDLCPSSRV